MARRKLSNEDAPKVKLSKENITRVMGIFQFVRPYKWQLIAGMILLFLSSVVFMLFPYLAGLMVDVAQGNSSFNLTLRDIGWLLLGVLVVQGTVSYFRVLLFASLSERSIADVRKAVYSKLITLPVFFFEQSRVGELISRITADIERLYNAFSITIAEFVRQIIILIAGIIFLAITTPRLALIMLSTFPVIVVGAFFFGKFIRRLSRQRQQELAETNTILGETIQSIHTVKAFTNEWHEVNRYGSAINNMVKIALKFAKGRAVFAVFIVSILFGALFFIIWQGAVMVQDGRITAGQLIAFVSYTAIIGGAIAGLGNFYTELLGAVGATERVSEIMNTPGEVNLVHQPGADHKALSGNIVFENVRFRYPAREDIEVLKGVSLEIKSGQKVAVAGASGAGKSTIMQLLLRFYDTQEGRILLDGKNIYDYEISAYRNNFAIVPQEVLLFGGSIRENILYGNPTASEEEVIEAAKKSNSWEFISTFPEGLETLVGERGIKLSGGQRQRIAIARAILRDPAVLLLDEATSSLDAESEKVVQEALYTLMEGRTSIIIAHRLATIRDVDCIYVIEGGRIVEQGTHMELSMKENGAYSNLAKLQFETI